jgi:hypothetical protein
VSADNTERVGPGQRNDYLTRKAGQLRRPGFSVEAMYAALLQENHEHCDPPLEDDEVRRIADSVGRYPPAEKHTTSDEMPVAWRLLDDVALMQLSDPDWLISGMVPRRGVGALVAQSGAGKTTFAAQMKVAIATEQPLFGHTVRHGGASVYVATEDPSGFKVRLRAAKRSANLSLEQSVGIYTFPEAIDLRDAVSVARFTRFLQQTHLDRPLELIVIDTYAASMPGASENSSEDTTLAMAHAHQWREQLQATVMIVHHTNAAGTRERGHSAMRGALDFLITLTPR